MAPAGAVTGRAGRNGFSGSLDGKRLPAGRHGFDVRRSGNGFIATAERQSTHRVVFQRMAEGGGCCCDFT
jgi:hypothetical protein